VRVDVGMVARHAPLLRTVPTTSKHARSPRPKEQSSRASLKLSAADRQQGDGKVTVGLVRGDIYIWSASDTGPTMV
jgi:hypothetical protein